MKRAGVVVDLGGTKIRSAASDQPEHAQHWPTRVERGADGLADQVADSISYWNVRSGERVVVATAGYLDVGSGRILHASNLPFENYPLRDRLSETLQCPVDFIGDTTAATLAELSDRSRTHHENGLYVTISTGIGMGAMREGRLDRFAGIGDRELGHMQVNPNADADLCGCGRRGCLEAYGSGSSIVRHYLEALERADARPPSSDVTVSTIVAASEGGDARARAVLDQALDYLTDSLASAAREARASILVLGGGVIVHANMFEPLRKRLVRTIGRDVVIERSIYGELSGIHGAAAICERREDVMRALEGYLDAP